MMKSIMTADGYVFFSSLMGWVDYIKPDGTPYRIDMVTSDELIEEWIKDGFAKVYQWTGEWVPLYEGPFDSEQEATDYRDTEVNRVMPTRIRSITSFKDGKTIWFIDCQREVTA